MDKPTVNSNFDVLLRIILAIIVAGTSGFILQGLLQPEPQTLHYVRIIGLFGFPLIFGGLRAYSQEKFVASKRSYFGKRAKWSGLLTMIPGMVLIIAIFVPTWSFGQCGFVIGLLFMLGGIPGILDDEYTTKLRTRRIRLKGEFATLSGWMQVISGLLFMLVIFDPENSGLLIVMGVLCIFGSTMGMGTLQKLTRWTAKLGREDKQNE